MVHAEAAPDAPSNVQPQEPGIERHLTAFPERLAVISGRSGMRHGGAKTGMVPVPAGSKTGGRRTAPVLYSFPSRYIPRKTQKRVIADIESAIKSGYRNILLCVPTGVGKSHIAVAVARHLGSSFVITAQKILQDQYTRDFGFMPSMKGKTNFPCLDLYDPRKQTYSSAKTDPSLSCRFGTCMREVSDETGGKWIEHCEHKPSIFDFGVKNHGTENEAISAPSGMCHYYTQKFSALMAAHAVFNYPSYFQTRLYPKGVESRLNRRCLVADEAHEIEDQIIGYIGFDILSTYMREAGLEFKDFVANTVKGVLELLELLDEAYRKIIKKKQNDSPDSPTVQRLRTIEEKMYMMTGEIRREPDNFVVQENRNFAGNTLSVSIKPIEIGKYTRQFFDMPYQLFMSATIHKERFCKTMGVPTSKCAFIEVERSPFPARNRRITFHDVKWLNRNSTKADYDKVYGKAADIIKKYAGKKGLVLTTTRDQCQAVRDAAGPRIAIAHEGVEGGREAVLKAHARSRKPNVLVSPSCWYGVDLKDDLSRFQIVIKTPYPSLADRRTKIKWERDPDWYRYATLVKLLQGFGRSVRGDGDHCDTHVLDGNASGLLKRHKDMVPKAYHDVLGWKSDK